MTEAETARARAIQDRDSADGRARSVAAQLSRLTAERDAAAAERPAAEKLEAARAATASAEAALAQAREALSGAEAARAAAASAHSEARAAAGAKDAARARAAAERQGLMDLLRSREPAASAPILDAITVPPGLEAALGAALGEGLESPADPAAPRHWRLLPPWAPWPRRPAPRRWRS
ncbi:hypothetical protein ACFQU7_01935 [Pseudoroseomonas wenyumeiae]